MSGLRFINFFTKEVVCTNHLGIEHRFKATEDQLYRIHRWYQYGGNIQDMLPDLSDSQRELLLTGISDEEWDELFSDE